MFLDRFNRKSHSEKTVAPEVLAKMQKYDWPGNIRELRNMLERLVVLSAGNEISEKDLRTTELRNDVQPTIREIDWPVELTKITKSLEDNYIEQAMAKGGSIREAAKLLKISPSMLYRKMNRE
jgi:DNA-binding NtrC family response regulator